MNEQNDHIWMHKKPETVFDWLAIIAISIALYLMLGHLNVFAGGIAKFLDVVAPFASGIVIAYVLDCIVRPVQRYVMKENPKLRWLSILIAYIVAALIITLLVSMVVPQVVSSITMLFTNLPLYISNVQNLLDMLQNRYGLDLSRATEMLDNYESMMNSLTEVLKSSAPQIMAYVSGGIQRGGYFYCTGFQRVHAGRKRQAAAPAAHHGARVFPAVYCRYRAGNLQLCQQQF